jgi:hypothetical protein
VPRYKSSKILNNDSEFYKFLRVKRGIKNIRHYSTPILYNPTAADRVSTPTVSHVWKYGDRYYKLSSQYYGTPKYWWVIAWWNGRPTEATVQNGAVLQIPTNLEDALSIMGTY